MGNILLVQAVREDKSSYEKIMKEHSSEKISEDNDSIEKLEDVNSTSEVAKILHNNAWSDLTDKAEENPAYKYAIYQSRSIAVKHPEIYLQADALFNHLLISEENMEEYYRERTQDLKEQSQKYNEIRMMDGNKFKWSSFSINDYRKIGYQEIYHTDAFLPYVDIKLHFMGSALKGTDWQATPLSMVEFLYFKHGAKKDSFIIMTEKGKTYLYLPSGFLSTEKLIRYDGKEKENIDGKVVLIFNKDYVWYPLMGRDDRNKSNNLNKLVKNYGRKDSMPQLTIKEKELVKKLKENTQFTDKKDKTYALYYAGKLHAYSWSYYPDIFEELYPRYSKKAGFGRSHAPIFITYRNARIAWLSNLLSPINAKLAAVARENSDGSLNQIISNMISEYLKYAETRDGHSNLELWFHSELNYLNLDDNLLSKAANCIYSATNTAAILDLASIPNLDIYVVGLKYQKRGGGHAYTAVFKDNEYGVMENGGWSANFNGLYDKRIFERNGIAIGSITTDNGWINFSNEKDIGIKEISTSLKAYNIDKLLKKISKKTAGKTEISIEHTPDKVRRVENITDFINEISKTTIKKYKF